MNRPAPELIDGKEAWYVERIVNKKVVKNKVYYLVKWCDYPSFENTWEPATTLKKQAKEHVDYYEESLQN